MRGPAVRRKSSRPETMWPPPCSTRRITDSAVTDLPDPDSPTMAMVSARPTANETSRTAATVRSAVRNSTDSPDTVRTVSAPSGIGRRGARPQPGVAARCACRRRAWMVAVMVIASGSMRRCSSAGRPDSSARSQGRRELLGARHRFAVRAVGARQRGEIGVDQIGAVDPPGIVALLVHADGAVHAVVDDDERRREAVVHGGGEFLAVHQKASVAVPGHDDPIRMHAPWRRSPPARRSPSRRCRARAACDSAR